MNNVDFRVVETNLQWDSLTKFKREDKHLSDLSRCAFVYNFQLEKQIAEKGVFLLFGGRQIGKTTALKQMLLHALEKRKISSLQTIYINCDFFVERRELETVLKDFYSGIDRSSYSLIIIDEVCNLKEWQLTLKAFIDLGWTQNSTVVLTGSDKILLEDGAKGFPGVNRRGTAGVDIELFPLSFKEYINLVAKELLVDPKKHYAKIEKQFRHFLSVGGYLSAINLDYLAKGRIDAVYNTYRQWIVSDFLRKGKDKNRLIDLLRIIVEKYGSQISFNKIANESSGLSTETVINYLEHLERLGVILILQAYDQNKRRPFPKKEKRIHFCDPFIAQTILFILREEKILPVEYQIEESLLVESVVVASYSRLHKTYFIKAEGEVDLVVLREKGFTPIEVKWTEKLRMSELKQILKYPNGIVLNKNLEDGTIEQAKCKNLIFDLLS